MNDACHCGCEASASYGTRSMRVLDHQGGFAFRDVVRHRLRCRSCGTTRSRCEQSLADGFRMTQAAYDAIVAACLGQPFSAVAAEAGVAERTVRDVFAHWSDRLLAPDRLSVPSVAILRSCAGPAGPWPQVVDGLSGTVCAAFPDLSDPRFARYLGRFAASDMHLDVPCIGLARRHVPEGNLLSLHRLAARAHVEGLLPRCLVRLRGVLNHAARMALRGMGTILLKSRFDLSRPESLRLSELCERHPLLSRFSAACEEVRAVWLISDARLARGRLSRWAANLDRSLRSAFQPVLAFVESLGELVFTDGYGRISKETWTDAGRPTIQPAPGQSGPIRTVCRILLGPAPSSTPDDAVLDPSLDLSPSR